ncbi:cupin domain-containing protein [Synechococcus sp. PCC 7336]|uniref:cupin domain-containing protein n=1 Tax=Synechococcus sp. PCC 7336 TaxID=195250 RepID=UPI000345657D|nr:cupin domain-containing protein [Synechococcus sp. PCC 7336]
MAKALLQMQASALQIRARLEYPETGILSKVLLGDENCQYMLFCLATGSKIAEHRAPRNATIHVLEGSGKLTLNGQVISLEPGIFAVMPARTPHALTAIENLAFLLILSEPAPPLRS